MRVIFTPSAVRRLDQLYDYVAERAGERRADAYIGRIISYCKGFSTFPMRGVARDDLLPGLRIVGFERRATIAFVITPEAVLIEGVFHHGQDWESQFEENR